MRKQILEGKSDLDIFEAVRKEGFMKMQEDGVLKVLEGMTTLQEVMRVSY